MKKRLWKSADVLVLVEQEHRQAVTLYILWFILNTAEVYIMGLHALYQGDLGSCKCHVVETPV